jgi:hypothetical protein
MKYTYYPKTDSFEMGSEALRDMLRRMQAPKEKLEAEDKLRNVKLIQETRKARGLKPWHGE